MITIGKNKNLDESTYEDFHDFSTAGVDFGEIIGRNHKGIEISNYKNYINNYYRKHASELEKVIYETNKVLATKCPDFFSAVERYFHKNYGNRNYAGFVSIFNCNPRFVENQTFQVYYKKTLFDRLEVCFHEAMHFAFFDFCAEHSAQTRELDTNSGPFWELSEIVNVILLNKPEFQNVLDTEELLFYPALANKLKAVEKIWNANLETMSPSFISESLKYLSGNA